jgi:hypothetical protein
MKDIKINSSLDVSFENGDFVVGDSTEQHQQLLLVTNKGDWKEDPTIAVGVQRFLKDEDNSGLLTEIKKEFERDGMRVNKIELSSDSIIIDAPYK